MSIAQENLKRLESQFFEKQIDIKSFQIKKEQTEIKIAELDDKMYNELPVIKENLISQYEAEKEDKLKNYNPIDFIKERAEENKTFFKLNFSSKEEKSEEKENISTQQALEQDKPRGFRR